MANINSKRNTEKRTRRQNRIRAKIHGTSDRPRLSVFKSNNGVYAQLIDDTKGATIAASSTVEFSSKKGKIGELAIEVGKAIAKKAAEKNIKKVVFDRGGYIYTGKIKAVADGARAEGLEF